MGFGFNFEFVKNTRGHKELEMLLPFAAGSTTLISPGQLLILSGGVFTPLTSDTAMSGVIAVAKKRITAAHLAGYYPAIVPQPGDIFRAILAAAGAVTRGEAVYVTDSTQKLAVSGTNQLGTIFDTAGYPIQQGDADVGDVADRGTTVGSVAWVLMMFKKATSYYAALEV